MIGPRSPRDRLDRIVSIARRAGRFYKVGIGVLVVGCAAAVAIAVLRPRVYRSETLILYRETIRNTAIGDSLGEDPARKLGLRLKEMVLSRTRLQQIIEEYKLYPEIVEDRGYVDAVDEMRNHIAFRVRDGDTFGLGFDGPDSKMVQTVTAKLADALIEENSRHRVEQATVTKQFLDEESEHLEIDLKEKETQRAKFLSVHPEFAMIKDGQQAAPRVVRNVASPVPKDPALLALEREAARLEARLGMPPTQRKTTPQPTPESKMVQEAEAELQSAQKDLADKLSHFTDQHPDVRAARARVKTAELKLRRWSALEASVEQPSPVESVDEKERVDLSAELQRINVEIAQLRARKRPESPAPEEPTVNANKVVALETEWTRIERDVAEARTRRLQLEDKQFKASIAASSASSERNAQIMVVDPAFFPTHPSKPSRSTIAMIGGVVAALLALLAAFGCALLDDRLYDRFDIEQLELVPLMAVVPRASGGRGDARPGGKAAGRSAAAGRAPPADSAESEGEQRRQHRG